jgi:ABC-type multidrug transport system ATPase subunit
MSGHEPSLALEGILKEFDAKPVLRQITVSFRPGECVLLLGANGAGKSTLLRVLAGLCQPDAGKRLSSFFGTTGFLSQHLFLYGRLTVEENLALFSGVSDGEPVDDIVSRWGLVAYRAKIVAQLSRGNQARVALARTFIGNPSIVLLDEPSSHLDEQGMQLLTQVIKGVESGRINKPLRIVATHDIHRLGPLATRILVLANGRILADSGPDASPDECERVIGIYRESNR